ncbi:Hypothetical protein SMAX5B_019353 [Scophthalmus maximus]|uniref:Uncharacterized protein n=1 Tax=Scophthalmus maximus TaxID=52904 RepID=A0A2U9BWT0_SCOMX|nr:Hypothetical protein SMAX5B_019353 [Scophthalmus maximus]
MKHSSTHVVNNNNKKIIFLIHIRYKTNKQLIQGCKNNKTQTALSGDEKRRAAAGDAERSSDNKSNELSGVKARLCDAVSLRRSAGHTRRKPV